MKKVFFLHIPKTAGTSLIDLISSHYDSSRCAIHFENNDEWVKLKPLNTLADKEFLSGHVRFPMFMKRRPDADYFNVTILRKPIEQTISHISWIRQLSESGNEGMLAQHPSFIQDMSKKLKSLNLSDAPVIKDYVERMPSIEKEFFDNCQTRYFLQLSNGQSITEKDIDVALGNLEKIDLLGLNEYYFATLLILCYQMNWSPPERLNKLNVSTSKFGLESNNETIRESLEELIRFDNIIYEAARQRFFADFYKMIEVLDKRYEHTDFLGNCEIIANALRQQAVN